MAIVANLGTAMTVGQQTSLLSIDFSAAPFDDYIIETSTDGSYEIDSEDIYDSEGKRDVRLFFNRNRNVTLNLICQSDATPLTDFPEGAMMAGDFATWYVESAKLSKSKSATRVALTLSQLFTNANADTDI